MTLVDVMSGAREKLNTVYPMREGPVTEEEVQEYLDIHVRRVKEGGDHDWRDSASRKRRLMWLARFKEYGALGRVLEESEKIRKPLNDEIARWVKIWLESDFVAEAREHLKKYTNDEDLIEGLIQSAAESEVVAEMSTGIPRPYAAGLAQYLWLTKDMFNLVGVLKFHSTVDRETREGQQSPWG